MRRHASEICIYLLLGGALALSSIGAASAADTFVCADGRRITIDSSNRDALANDPCVQAWFAKVGPQKQAELARDQGSPLKRAEPTTVIIRKYNRSRRATVDSN